jgi:hypothetical protein
MIGSSADIHRVRASCIETARQCRQLSMQLEETLELVLGDLESTDADAARSDCPQRTGNWQTYIFGEPIASDLESEIDGKRLLAGLTQGQLAALDLVGRLWIWRAASAECLPPLLKEIGESFYRWSAELASEPVALRDALINWLEQIAARAGLGHRIELVSVGDRLERTRHNAPDTGLEVRIVQGWVVLRENGSVYTKALVATR